MFSLFMLYWVLVLHYFLRPTNTLLYKYAIFYLFISWWAFGVFLILAVMTNSAMNICLLWVPWEILVWWKKGRVLELVSFFPMLPFHSSTPIDEKPPTTVPEASAEVIVLETCFWFSLPTSVPCSWMQECENRKATVPPLFPPSAWECCVPQYDFHSHSFMELKFLSSALLYWIDTWHVCLQIQL